jgi:hypothetical protein
MPYVGAIGDNVTMNNFYAARLDYVRMDAGSYRYFKRLRGHGAGVKI